MTNPTNPITSVERLLLPIVSHSDRCGFGNQDSPCSCAALATLRNRLEASGIASLEAEVARYREALEDVRAPIRYLRRMADAQGQKLGPMAYTVANSPGLIAEIVRAALSQHTDGEQTK
jgi:uncharacterized heparinase superfamily protein